MSEPITYCRHCKEALDVYMAPEDRFCCEEHREEFRAEYPGLLEKQEAEAYERDRAEALNSIGWFG